MFPLCERDSDVRGLRPQQKERAHAATGTTFTSSGADVWRLLTQTHTAKLLTHGDGMDQECKHANTHGQKRKKQRERVRELV